VFLLILTQHLAEPPAAGRRNRRTARPERAGNRPGRQSICVPQRARAPRYAQASSSGQLAGRAGGGAGSMADSCNSGTARTRSYDVVAAFMLLQVHGWGIHALRTGRRARATSHGTGSGAHEHHGATAGPTPSPHERLKLTGIVLERHERGSHAVWIAAVPARGTAGGARLAGGRLAASPVTHGLNSETFVTQSIPERNLAPHQAVSGGLWRVRRFRSRTLTYGALRYWRIFVWSICARCDQVKVLA
jgi:hypothetical protein